MTPVLISQLQADALRAVPIEVEILEIEDGLDGIFRDEIKGIHAAVARGLWQQGLLIYHNTDNNGWTPFGRLLRTPAGDEALAAFDASAP